MQAKIQTEKKKWGEIENAGYRHFLRFQQCFHELSQVRQSLNQK